jgi:hypothetical protein
MKGIIPAAAPARGSIPYPGGVQSAAAGIRQAQDPLPAVGAHIGRHPGHPGHLHASDRFAMAMLHSATGPVTAANGDRSRRTQLRLLLALNEQ